MTCETPCKNCSRKGLPILFTRYAAAYSAQQKGMDALAALKPAHPLQATPGGVAMKTALYNLRMLRAGYLYVHTDRVDGSCINDEWKGYVVHPHGYLTEFDISAAGDAVPLVACSRDAALQANRSMVWVKEAREVKKLWYMFHPDLIDHKHLFAVIAKDLPKYMQSFDVAGWAGGSTNQKDTIEPHKLDNQTVEYAALSNPALRSACEPLMYGLMGSNPKERAWGNYSQMRRRFTDTGGGAAVGARPLGPAVVEQPDYDAVHGGRLKKLAEFLKVGKGAVVACDDAIGIAQELGHLQIAAQALYTQWQNTQAEGHAGGVTNEWVFQAAIGGNGLMSMAEKGALARVDQAFDRAKSAVEIPLPRDPLAASQEQARRINARQKNHARELSQTMQAIRSAYDELFDQSAAEKVMATQASEYESCEAAKAKLGRDQVEWLTATALTSAMGRYSDKDDQVGKMGGGATLTVQLAQCMAGTESNSGGLAWLHRQDIAGNGVLGRALCFNNLTIKKVWSEVAAAQVPLAEEPRQEPITPGVDGASEGAKTTAMNAGLGDKALGFQDALREARVGQATATLIKRMAGQIGLADQAQAMLEALKALDDSGALRRAAWPLHLASLLSVKMMQKLNELPLSQIETRIARYTALTGLVTMGKTAEAHAIAMKLPLTDQDALQQARRKVTNAAHATNAAVRAPNARAAALAGVFDLGQAALKGRQLAAKGDARTASEMVGSLFQAVGSIADWRAKAYEETVFKGMTMLDLANSANTKEVFAARALQDLQLRAVRMTAVKFLVPAAIVSVFWDAMDALRSYKRSTDTLLVAQVASVAATVFAITSTIMSATGAVLGISAAAWSIIAATFGLIGAALAVVSAIAIYLLKEDEWKTWLRDNPLNKQRQGAKPIHKNLQDTLQQLANAKAALA